MPRTHITRPGNYHGMTIAYCGQPTAAPYGVDAATVKAAERPVEATCKRCRKIALSPETANDKPTPAPVRRTIWDRISL